MNKYISLESTIRSLGAKSASQPMEKDMNDQVHAGSYTSKNFEVSKAAQKLFADLPKHIDSDDAEESMKLHDKLFDIHKKVKASDRASEADIITARRLHDQILKISRDMKIEDRVGHVKDSLDFIKSKFDSDGKAKTDVTPDDAKKFASPPKDYQSDVKSDSDVDNLAKFYISRDKRAQRKLKIIDDEFKPGEQSMGKISDAMKQVLANEAELNEKKKMTKADIAALKEPKGKIDGDDLAALRAGEHKKKTNEETNIVDEGIIKDALKGAAKETLSKYGVLGKSLAKSLDKKKTNEETEMIDEVHAYSVKLKNGLSKASSGKTWWHTTEEGARKRNEASHGGEGKVVKVKLEPDEYAYNGRAVKEEVEELDELSIYKMQAVSKEASRRNKDMSDPKGIKHQVYGAEVADEKIKKKAGTYWPSTVHKIVDKIGDKLKGKAMADYNKNYSAKKDKKNFGEEVEALDEAMFVVITKGSERKRIRNNPIEIARARKEGWAISEETVVEANALKAVGNQQKKAIVQREVQQKKAMFAKKDAVDKQKFGKAMQKIHAGDEVEMDKKKVFMEKAIAILGEEYAELSFEELVEEVKKARGRPRKHPPKDPNAPKRPRGRPKKGSSPSAPAKPGSAPAADTDKDREHIVMGLRKAISLRGEHHVKFADGSSHKIPAEHAQKALKMHDSLSRPSEKMVFARKLAASHDSFKKALADKSPGSDEKKKSGITLAKRAD